MKITFSGVIAPITILLPFFWGISKYRQLKPSAKVVWLYLAVSTVVNLTATIVARVYHQNNLPLLHIFTVAEFFILLLYYQRLLFSGTVPVLFRIMPFIFFLLCIINAVFFQNVYTHNSYAHSLEALVVMLLAVNYFARLAAAAEPQVTKLPDFWFNTGFFLYFSGSFILFVFSNFILRISKQQYLVLWDMHAAFVLLMYLLFTIGFTRCKK